jgi:catechol 2,3-dioxygenase-like lactoylglutathione lyase family enzyme
MLKLDDYKHPLVYYLHSKLAKKKGTIMLNHLSLGAQDLDKAVNFYQHAFDVLDYKLQHKNENEAAFGKEDQWIFWLYPIEANVSLCMPGTHIAINGATKSKIIEFHKRAIDNGGRSIKAPGYRPEISQEYFGTIIEDLDGHRIEVVLISH